MDDTDFRHKLNYSGEIYTCDNIYVNSNALQKQHYQYDMYIYKTPKSVWQ